ncbi:MAG: hypothetical protein M3Q27_11885, partial [Actinomycetota bacterium]|nr:hypothetical protein [Actinomycetota bacterium]
APALAGHAGLPACAARLTGHAACLREAVVCYAAADELGERATAARRALLGAGLPFAAPVVVGVGLPVLAGYGVVTGRSPSQTVARLTPWLLDHPGLLGELVGMGPTAITVTVGVALGALGPVADAAVRRSTGERLFPRTVPDAARLLALAYPRTTPSVRPAPVSAGPDVPAAGVADLVASLQRTDAAARGTRAGEIAVRRVTSSGPHGPRVAWIVDIPGTRRWSVDPRRPRTSLNDLATNLETMGGSPSARVDAVGLALRRAGARPGEPVLLVGHSQGGMVAASAARRWRGRGHFTVTHVLAVGSPVGQVDVPDGVHVLAVEDEDDPTVQVDARDNPDRPTWTTVTTDVSDDDGRSWGTRHSIEATYGPAARAVDDAAPSSRSIRAYLDSAEVFLAADGEVVEVDTVVYDLVPGPRAAAEARRVDAATS